MEDGRIGFSAGLSDEGFDTGARDIQRRIDDITAAAEEGGKKIDSAFEKAGKSASSAFSGLPKDSAELKKALDDMSAGAQAAADKFKESSSSANTLMEELRKLAEGGANAEVLVAKTRELAEAQRQAAYDGAEALVANQHYWTALNTAGEDISQVQQRHVELAESYTVMSERANNTKAVVDEYSQRLQQESEKLQQVQAQSEGAATSTENLGNKTKKATEDVNGFNGKLDDTINKASGIPGPVGSAVSSIKNLTTASLRFIATPLGAVLAAISAALAAMTSWFKRSEEGQNALAVSSAYFTQVLNSVLDVADNVGEWLFKAFTKPKEALSDLVGFLKSQVINRLKAVGEIASGIWKMLNGDFSEGAKQISNGYLQGLTGVQDVTGKVSKFMDETNKKAKQRQQIAQKQNELDRKERENVIERAKLEKQIAELREKAYNQKTPEKERAKAIKQAKELTNKMYNNEIDLAKKRYEIVRDTNALSHSNKEDKKKEAEAEAELYRLESQRAMAQKGLMREQNRIDSSMNKSAKAGAKVEKEQAAQHAKQIEEELRYQDELRKIRQEASDARRDAEIASIQNDAERERAEQDEQHERNLRQIEEQANEMRKAIYEHNKKAWENAHKDSPFENTEAGKAGWMGLQLSDDQQATIDALMQKENAEYLRLVEQRYDAERQATLDFLKEYGDFEQQKLAITEEYEKKIAEATTVTEKAALGLQKDKALKDLEKQQLEDSIDWAGVFNDLSGHTKEYLEGLRDQLQEILKTGDLPIDQMETVQTKIREINEAINDQSGMFHYASEAQREHTRRVEAAKDAQEQYNKLLNEQFNLQLSITETQKQLRDLVGNDDLDLSDVTKYDEILRSIGEQFGDKSGTYEKAKKILKELGIQEGKLNQVREQSKKKAFEWKKAEDGANEGFKDMVARVASNIKEWCNEFLGDLPDLLNEIGLSDAGEKVSHGLSGINNAANAAADFASQNYVGAALNAVKSIKDFGRALGIGGGNAAEINRQLERLSDRNEILTTAIDRLTDTMNGKHGQSAIKTYETLAKQQKELEKNLQKQLQLQMSYTGAHHSFNKKWKGFSSSELSTFNSLFGTNWNGDLSTLTSDMAANLLGMADMMQKIADTGDYGDRVVERIKELAAQAGKAEEQVAALNEALTTTTKENVFDDFLSSLYDLADGSEDVMDNIAKNWQQMVNRMVVNNLIGAKMQEQLENWYDQLATLNRQRTNGEIGDSYYKQQLERLQNLYNSYVQQGQSQIEQFREMGIIKAIDDAADKTTEDTLEYLDTIRSAFEQLVSDSETDMEAWGNNLRNAILQNLIQSKLLDEEFDKWANGWVERYSKLMSDLTDGTISQTDYDRQLAELNAEFDKTTGEISEKSKQMWEAFGIDAEETKSAFEDLHSSFLSTLTDINGDVEAWSKNITKTMVEQLVERNILNAAFDEQMDAWRESFESALEANDTEGLIALRKELEDLRGSLAKQAQEYMNALGYVQEVASDTTFKDMGGDFRSQLMNLDATAEDWAESVGRKMAEKIVDEMVSSTMIQPFLDELQKAFNAAMSVEGATVSSVLTALTPQIEAAKQAFEQAQPVVHDILAQLGITEKQVLPFSDLRSTFVNTLMDMEADAEKFGKEIKRTLIEQMIDKQLEKQFQDKLDELNNEWAKALQNGDSAAIENIRQQMVQLRESAAKAVQPLLDDLKELEYVAEDTPLSGLRSSFLSDLMDMESSTEDFADNINKILTEAFVDKFVLGKAFDEQLELWEKRYADIMEADIDEADRAKQLQDLQQSIGVAREHYTEQARAIQELMGYTNKETLADQEAHVNMADKATYDQFELYLGIATAQQIALEQGNDVRKQILSTLQTMSGITSPNGDTVKEIRSMLRTTNEHLYAIKTATEGIRAEFMPRLQSIDNKLSKL